MTTYAVTFSLYGGAQFRATVQAADKLAAIGAAWDRRADIYPWPATPDEILHIEIKRV